MRIGVLADTHGLLRPRVLELLAGCQVLLHAGDVGDPAVLAGLAALAPVHAVRGNVDHGALAALPAVLAGYLGAADAGGGSTGAGGGAREGAGEGASEAAGDSGNERACRGRSGGTGDGRSRGAAVAAGPGAVSYRMTHIRAEIPAAWMREARLVVFGHSHQPLIEWHGDCLLLNPGSCGPRRFRLPVTLALVTAQGGRLVPEIVEVAD
jgi:uncharacterized protein